MLLKPHAQCVFEVEFNLAQTKIFVNLVSLVCMVIRKDCLCVKFAPMENTTIKLVSPLVSRTVILGRTYISIGLALFGVHLFAERVESVGIKVKKGNQCVTLIVPWVHLLMLLELHAQCVFEVDIKPAQTKNSVNRVPLVCMVIKKD